MPVAELASEFDGGQARTQVIALGHGSCALEVQLRGQAVVHLHASQREIALLLISFRKTARGPLRQVETCGVG